MIRSGKIAPERIKMVERIKASDSQVERCEAALGISLPIDLKELLLDCNRLIFGLFAANSAPIDTLIVDSVEDIELITKSYLQPKFVDLQTPFVAFAKATDTVLLVPREFSAKWSVNVIDEHEIEEFRDLSVPVADSFDEFLINCLDSLAREGSVRYWLPNRGSESDSKS